MKNEHIWVEKYKPDTLGNYVFQNKANEEYITSCLSNNTIPNLMISGVQGTGKSSLIQMMMNELKVINTDIKHINASKDNGIDQVRDRITNFCSAFAMGEFKVIVLEEADGLSPQAQKALLAVMDTFAKSCRFLFTCNYPHKITPALHSRCQTIHLDGFDEGTMLVHVASILDAEGIAYDGMVLIDHVKHFNPDMRKVIQSVQQSSTNSTSTLGGIVSETSEDSSEQWKEIWQSNPEYDALVKLVGSVDANNFEEMFKIAYENFHNLPEDKIFKAYATVPDYIERGYIVAYQPMNMHGFLVEIFDKV